MKQKLELFRDNGQIVVSSKNFADFLGKQHGNIISSIENYSYTYGVGIPMKDVFFESYYMDKYNKKCKCYNITKKGYQYLISKMTKFNGSLSHWKLIKILEKKEQEFLENESNLEIWKSIMSEEESLNIGFDLMEKSNKDKFFEEARAIDESSSKRVGGYYLTNNPEDTISSDIDLLDEREVLGKQFKVYGTPEEPLFLAKDVAEWIDYDISKVGQMIKNVDEDEYITSPIYYSGQVRNMYFLTEEGLYEVLMQSRKPIAKEFKKQVKLILKEIRKHGMYATDELLDNPDLLIQVATKLKEEREKNALLILENKKNEDKINHLTPHATFSKDFLKSEGTIQIGSLAKHLNGMGIDIGRNRLFKCLRENKYVYYEEGCNVPSQKSINLGIMELEENLSFDRRGNPVNNRVTKITPKGMAYFYKKFKEGEIIY